MRFVRRIVAAAATAGLFIALAGPGAHAAAYYFRSAERSLTATFRYEGQQITCGVFGESSWEYPVAVAGSNEPKTFLFGYATTYIDNDPACDLIGTGVELVWRRRGTTEHDRSAASNFGPSQGARVDVSFEVVEFEVRHRATYLCDDVSVPGSVKWCDVTVTTRPK